MKTPENEKQDTYTSGSFPDIPDRLLDKGRMKHFNCRCEIWHGIETSNTHTSDIYGWDFETGNEIKSN